MPFVLESSVSASAAVVPTAAPTTTPSASSAAWVVRLVVIGSLSLSHPGAAALCGPIRHTEAMSRTSCYQPLRGLFMGAGSGLAEPGMAEHVVELTGTPTARMELLYLGTASYDAPDARQRQTVRFAELGCRVTSLDVATRTPATGEMAALVDRADVVLVSGGNTLYAVDRWVQLGLDRLLRRAAEQGTVACGGSAGAICWFDGGHSDSMDPTTYRVPAPADDPRAGTWRYIRVDGMGLLPGLLCPHYEVTQSNGLLRAHDFSAMLERHPGETGLGLDDWAGLLLDGEGYEIVQPPGRGGSVRGGAFVDDGSGVPGAWLVEMRDGEPRADVIAPSGRATDLLRPARAITPDPLLDAARAENPLPVA